MKGKTVVITGATSGIGQVAAERLAEMGARIVMVARSRSRGETALARLRGKGPANHAVHYADLSRLSEMKRVAAEIKAAEPKIDVLVNNAGAIFSARQVTEDCFERTFALNHLSYFVLTHGLLESIKAAAPARIVNTASRAHLGASLDFDDLQSAARYSAYDAYKRSKLANILFTRALARRLEGTGVTANCLHPGFVATRIGDQSGGWFAYAVRLAKIFAIKPEAGAKTIIHLASSPEVEGVSGGYFQDCRPAVPDPRAQDDMAAERLWRETEKLAGLTG